jgi:very-short-patch-repair endonuclease
VLVQFNMIDNSTTFEQFGYNPNQLKKYSRKLISVKCDYCHSLFNRDYNSLFKQRKTTNKDCCGDNKCVSLKRKETNKFLFGTEIPLRNKELKEKSKNTCIVKYGVSNFGKTEKSKLILKNNWKLNKDSILNKIKETCLNKYGYESFIASPWGISKIQSILDSKYGKTRSSIINKTKKTLSDLYNVDSPSKCKNHKEKVILTRIKNGHSKLYDGKTQKELAISLNKAVSTISAQIKKYGFEIAKTLTKKSTGIEQIIEEFLKSYNVLYFKNYKIENYIVDFYLTDYNLCIECDGLFWHCDKIQSDDNYHVKKRKIIIDLGYTFINFRENEIINTPKIVNSILLNKLNLTEKIYARKCEIKEITNQDEIKNYFNYNHLMGYGKGKCLGLIYNNKIVAAIQYTKSKNNTIEISRFCNLINSVVIGGYSKLLNKIELLYNPSKIKSFIDLRYGNKNSLIKIGFVEKSCYKSFKWVKGINSLHRLKFKSNTGYESGYNKLWDCGQLLMEKCYENGF